MLVLEHHYFLRKDLGNKVKKRSILYKTVKSFGQVNYTPTEHFANFDIKIEVIRYDIVQFVKCSQKFQRNQLHVSAITYRWL
jgi:hypothetical protein